MPPTLESLGIDRLSAADRRGLAEAILESISEQDLATSTHSPEWIAELLRREAEDDLYPDETFSWEEVKASARLKAGI